MINRKKETISFILIFSGLLIAIFGASTFGSFIITDVVFNKILKTHMNLGSIDLVARIFLLIIGFSISAIGVVLFRVSSKSKE